MLITVFEVLCILLPAIWKQRVRGGDFLAFGVNKGEIDGEEEELCMVASMKV